MRIRESEARVGCLVEANLSLYVVVHIRDSNVAVLRDCNGRQVTAEVMPHGPERSEGSGFRAA